MLDQAMRVIANAFVYFASVFILGFLLGTIRTLWLAPSMGALAAVLVELPMMIGFSWVMARRILSRRPLSRRFDAIAMGALAFAMLLGGEMLLGVLLFDLSPQLWLARLGRPEGLAGLAGQIGFGLLPALCGASHPGAIPASHSRWDQ